VSSRASARLSRHQFQSSPRPQRVRLLITSRGATRFRIGTKQCVSDNKPEVTVGPFRKERGMKKRECIWLLTAAVSILILASWLVKPGPATAQHAIKIGIAFPFTGPYAVLATMQDQAARIVFNQKNLEVAGRKIELIAGDTAARPDQTLSLTKKLVELDKVTVITGYLSTDEAYAVRNYLDAKKIPTLVNAAAAELSRKQFSRYIFRTAPSTYQFAYRTGKWWSQYGYNGKAIKKVAWVGTDYAECHESYGAFKKAFEEAGGQIVQELWTPLTTIDYARYVSTIKVDRVDAVALCMSGVNAVNYMRQWADRGLKGRVPIIGVGAVADEGVGLPDMGLNAEGMLWCHVSCPQTHTSENEEFISAFRKVNDKIPSAYAYLSYISAQAIYKALETVNGNVEDKDKFVKALETIEFTTPTGSKARYDQKHAMVLDLIIAETRRTNGECHLFELGRIKNARDPYKVFP
jgi:branched-chain amino acid transport system substrate-binding protein